MPSVVPKVYSTPNCVLCRATKKWLETRDLPYEEIALHEDLESLERFRGMGMTQAPIVEYEELLFSSLRPDLLEQIQRRMEGPLAEAV